MPNEIIKTAERAREYTEGYLAQIARQAEDDVAGKVMERAALMGSGKIVLNEAVLLKWITEAVRKAIT